MPFGPLRTLADLFAAGAHYIAERIYSGATSLPRLVNALQGHYGTSYQATNQAAGTLGARANAAVEAGRILTAGLPVDPLSIPVNNAPLAAGSYHYDTIVLHRIPDPINPGRSQSIRERIEVTSIGPMSPAEIKDMAEGIARARDRDRRSPEILNLILGSGMSTDVEFSQVISAYRGLGTR